MDENELLQQARVARERRDRRFIWLGVGGVVLGFGMVLTAAVVYLDWNKVADAGDTLIVLGVLIVCTGWLTRGRGEDIQEAYRIGYELGVVHGRTNHQHDWRPKEEWPGPGES